MTTTNSSTLLEQYQARYQAIATEGNASVQKELAPVVAQVEALQAKLAAREAKKAELLAAALECAKQYDFGGKLKNQALAIDTELESLPLQSELSLLQEQVRWLANHASGEILNQQAALKNELRAFFEAYQKDYEAAWQWLNTSTNDSRIAASQQAANLARHEPWNESLRRSQLEAEKEKLFPLVRL